MINKKILVVVMTVAMLTSTLPVFAQDLPNLSTPKLAPLQTPTLSTTFKDLRSNINKEGNLPDLPKLQTLPELDTSGFGKMEKDFGKGTVDLTKEGYGKKVELPNPTLSASNKDTLFAGINSQIDSAKAGLTSASIPVDQIRSKLSDFDKKASSMYSNAVSSNASNVDSKKAGASASVSAGDSAFQKALQGQFTLGNFDAPESSVPAWHYKPSSKITDRQAEISSKKSQIDAGTIGGQGTEVGGLPRTLSQYSPSAVPPGVEMPNIAKINSNFDQNLKEFDKVRKKQNKSNDTSSSSTSSNSANALWQNSDTKMLSRYK